MSQATDDPNKSNDDFLREQSVSRSPAPGSDSGEISSLQTGDGIDRR